MSAKQADEALEDLHVELNREERATSSSASSPAGSGCPDAPAGVDDSSDQVGP